MATRRFSVPTNYKIEFWTRASGRDRKCRSRFYGSAEAQIRAGARWESKGSDYWCRYWSGVRTWISVSRVDLAPALPLPEVLGRASELASIPARRPTLTAGARRQPMKAQIYSIFGQCEALAAEIMLKDGRLTRKIPVDDIPPTALFNQYGQKAHFAVWVPGDRIHEFDELCKDLRA
jgi:hypothetical protein